MRRLNVDMERFIVLLCVLLTCLLLAGVLAFQSIQQHISDIDEHYDRISAEREAEHQDILDHTKEHTHP